MDTMREGRVFRVPPGHARPEKVEKNFLSFWLGWDSNLGRAGQDPAP